jgi:hypothetical protein
MQTLTTGCKAFYDSFAGSVPCKVTQIDGTSGIANSLIRSGAFGEGDRVRPMGINPE